MLLVDHEQMLYPGIPNMEALGPMVLEETAKDFLIWYISIKIRGTPGWG